MSSNLKNTKKIEYRGILTFEVPKNWIEEYDEECGATFYEDSPTSGTLRVKLISIEVPPSKSPISATNVLEDVASSKESNTVLLSNKNVYNMFYEQTTDDGTEVTIYYWSLVQVVQFNKTRLVNFSYTILTDKLNAKSTKQEIDFITSQVQNIDIKPIFV